MAFRNPIVAGEELVIPGIRSEGYVEAVSGWRLAASGNAQVENLTVIDAVAASEVSADVIRLDGEDIAGIFAQIPQGMIAHTDSLAFTVNTANIGSTETSMVEFSWGPGQNANWYLVRLSCTIVGTTLGDVFALRMRYTTDGTKPDTSDEIMDGLYSHVTITNTGGGGQQLYMIAEYSPSGDWDQVRMLLTMARIVGSGTAYIRFTDDNIPLMFSVVDLGLQANAGGTIAQISKSTGTSDPDPVQTYTKEYVSTWSRSYDGDGGTRDGDDTAYCYQGYYSSTHGNTRSLIGFNYSQIMSDLSGATIASVKLRFKVAHAYASGGMTVVIGGHSYTAKPATWSDGSVDQNQTTKSSAVAGSTYEVTLPASFGTNLKSGTWKGIAIGPGVTTSPSTYYGYLYGATHTIPPKLTIVYSK